MNLMREADVLAASGEYAEAAQSYLRLVGHGDPDIHTAALLGLADARYRLDDEAGAQATWQAATQAPENAFSWLAWKQLAAALVRGGALRPAIDAYREAERRAPADQRAEISSRLGWLYKETGDAGRARGYFSRARGTDFTPWVTYLVIAVTVGIGLAQILSTVPPPPPPSPQDCAVAGTDPLMQLFCLDKGLVAGGQLYRLLSVVLVHEGIIHLGINMYALLIVGPLVERIYGHGLWVLMYLVTAAAASVLSYILTPEDAVGASGAIFGLFGALGATLWFYKPMIQGARGLAQQIIVIVIINLVLDVGLDAGGVGIDIFAHIGGLLAGIWLGLVVAPRGVQTLGGAFRRPGEAATRNPGLPPILQSAAVVALIAVIGAGLALGTALRVG